MTAEIKSGTLVIIVDAYGNEIQTTALSGIEPIWSGGKKIHDFPVVWVQRPLNNGGFEPAPWPFEAVRLA